MLAMGKYGKSKNKRKKNTHKNGNVSSTSTYSQGESDIPGYYFDEEKKTYFKILPSMMSSVSSFVTKETIKKKRDEKQRILDLNGQSSKSHNNSRGSPSLRKEKIKKYYPVEPLLNVLHSMQCGQQTCKTLHHRMLKHSYLGLKPQSGWERGRRIEVAGSSASLDGIQKLEVTNDRDKAVVVWSKSGFMSQYIKLMTLQTKRRHSSIDEESNLNLTIQDAGFQGRSADKVTSMCWSSFPRIPGKACLLYTSVCPVGYSRSRAALFDLEATQDEESDLFSYDLGTNAVWSCAWSHQRSRFSVGCERKCHIVDVQTRSKWTYSTQNSDSLAQLFSQSNPHMLFAGTRNGFVMIMDLRTHSQNDGACKLNHRSPVVCLKSLKDENYLMASDFSGLIRLWDLRAQKSVNQYHGLVNSHHQIPFYLDDSEKFVVASGTNCYCHIWDISDGSPLRTIPPPLQPQQGCLAISHLSESWGGIPGNYGILTGMAEKYFLYS